jgi:hypothetical protein
MNQIYGILLIVIIVVAVFYTNQVEAAIASIGQAVQNTQVATTLAQQPKSGQTICDLTLTVNTLTVATLPTGILVYIGQNPSVLIAPGLAAPSPAASYSWSNCQPYGQLSLASFFPQFPHFVGYLQDLVSGTVQVSVVLHGADGSQLTSSSPGRSLLTQSFNIAANIQTNQDNSLTFPITGIIDQSYTATITTNQETNGGDAGTAYIQNISP